ncbi:unnamed protein product, partial [Owenia fusiformis]
MWRGVVDAIFVVAHNILNMVGYIGKPILEVFTKRLTSKTEASKLNDNGDKAIPDSQVVRRPKIYNIYINGNNNKIIHYQNKFDEICDTDESNTKVQPLVRQDIKQKSESIEPTNEVTELKCKITNGKQTAGCITQRCVQPISPESTYINIKREESKMVCSRIDRTEEWVTSVAAEPPSRDESENPNDHVDLQSIITTDYIALNNRNDILNPSSHGDEDSLPYMYQMKYVQTVDKRTNFVSDTATEPSVSDQSERHGASMDLLSIVTDDHVSKNSREVISPNDSEDSDSYDDTSADKSEFDIIFAENSKALAKYDQYKFSNNEKENNGDILLPHQDSLKDADSDSNCSSQLDSDSGSNTTQYEVIYPHSSDTTEKYEPKSIYDTLRIADSESEDSDRNEKSDKRDTDTILPNKDKVTAHQENSDSQFTKTNKTYFNLNINNGEIILPYKYKDSDSDSESSDFSEEESRELKEELHNEEEENIRNQPTQYENSYDENSPDKSRAGIILADKGEVTSDSSFTNQPMPTNTRYEDENEEHYEELPYTYGGNFQHMNTPSTKIFPVISGKQTSPTDSKSPTRKYLIKRITNKVRPMSQIKLINHNTPLYENLDTSTKQNIRDMFRVQKRPPMPLPANIPTAPNSAKSDPNLRHESAKSSENSFVRESPERKPVCRRKTFLQTATADQNHVDATPTTNKEQQTANYGTHMVQKIHTFSESITDDMNNTVELKRKHVSTIKKNKVTDTENSQIFDSDDDFDKISPFSRTKVIRKKKKQISNDMSEISNIKVSRSVIHTANVKTEETKVFQPTRQNITIVETQRNT